jgi:hypothetical protein
MQTQWNCTTLEQLFEEALDQFPYELMRTGYADGTFEVDGKDLVEYTEEFTFWVGQLLDIDLVAGGWIDVNCEADGQPSLSGQFGIALSWDWQNGATLFGDFAINADYDMERKHWELTIDFR